LINRSDGCRVSVLPSGNHLVRLSVDSWRFRTICSVTVQWSFAGQALFGNLEHRSVLNLAIAMTEAVDVR
jgi:hypothetical protein